MGHSRLVRGRILEGVGEVSHALPNCDGFENLFWHDVWFGNLSLKDDFLELFGISHFKDAYVVDHCQLWHDSI